MALKKIYAIKYLETATKLHENLSLVPFEGMDLI